MHNLLDVFGCLELEEICSESYDLSLGFIKKSLPIITLDESNDGKNEGIIYNYVLLALW